jgi:hypothetical protein
VNLVVRATVSFFTQRRSPQKRPNLIHAGDFLPLLAFQASTLPMSAMDTVNDRTWPSDEMPDYGSCVDGQLRVGMLIDS